MNDSPSSQSPQETSIKFDLDSIREIAQLLRESELGEICLEFTAEDQPKQRLRLRRAATTPAPVYYAAPELAAPPLSDGGTNTSVAEPEAAESTGPTTFDITSLAVGVFREAKVTVQVGDEVKARQVLGNVESLRVPNEIVTPSAGRIVEILASEGQGIEYGQTLFVLEEIA